MARQEINIGIEGNDGTGDSVRESFRKVNENLQELYSVFGIGGQIGFTDLDDTPDTYDGNENKIPVVRSDGTGVDFLELASDNALDGTIDTMGFDFSVDGKLVIKQLTSKISNDLSPILGGPLNASTFPIAGVDISQDSVNLFNSVYGTSYSIDNLVIDKGYADRNYQPRDTAGGGLRITDEPTTTDIYTYVATGITNLSGIEGGNLIIPDHGLSSQYDGAEFIFKYTGPNVIGPVDGEKYFINVRNQDTISLHSSLNGARSDTDHVPVSLNLEGTVSITDAAYDPTLEGNWLSNVALPRKSIVRRQGDDMEGILSLSDHPGNLSGFGIPNGPDDLQAATKFYVDSVAKSSQVNLYVSESGDDFQSITPVGSEGRNSSYAYKTIGAASRKAEEIILSSPYTVGPYLQTITNNNNTNNATVTVAGYSSPVVGRNNVRTGFIKNKKFLSNEIIAYLKSKYPNTIFSDNLYIEKIEYILDAISLDVQLGNNSNYLSRWAGISFYSDFDYQNLIGNQKEELLDGIDYLRSIVLSNILTNEPVENPIQTRFEQYIDDSLDVETIVEDVVDSRFSEILGIIENGIFSAPDIVDGNINNSYKLNIFNGNNGFVDQADPSNTDLIVGKVIRGKTSGAIGEITNYLYESDPNSSTPNNNDVAEIRLLEPIEFIAGEELEYGNIVRNTQVTIFIESGTYEEDYPIRVPANVSIKGDEFRRVIIRPRDRISQSPWANLFFYRDREFDGLVLGKSNISEIGNFVGTGNHPSRDIEPDPAEGDSTTTVFTIDRNDYDTDGYGDSAIFQISTFGDGSLDIQIVDGGKDFRVGDSVSILGSVIDTELGTTGSPDVQFEVTKVPNGVEYTNPLTGNIDGYFGRHYLSNPEKNINLGPGYINIGDWKDMATVLQDNKNIIVEQVLEKMEFEGLSVYNKTEIQRHLLKLVGYLSQDLINGGSEFAKQAQGEWYNLEARNGIESFIEIGLDYIVTLAEELVIGATPPIIGSTEQIEFTEFDLFNGNVEPSSWESGRDYFKDDVVKFNTLYYKSKSNHTAGDLFADDIDLWDQVNGTIDTIRNLLNTVLYSFNNLYNPPLNNKDCDVFLLNNTTILRNISVQGHGGFMCVLDPEGQVLTKSPYIQTGSSFSASKNQQAFRGGLFIDAFAGNTALQVTDKVDGNPFILQVESLPGQGLFIRRPETPAAFYIDGYRFQINSITNYDPDTGTAILVLDKNSNEGNGFTGVTSQLTTGVDLDNYSSPIPITVQTAGNRSMLGNDFTQINDLGYGLVCVNGALSEMVSMFTYYCWISYYSKNGSQIRSLTGSSCYGEYGLVAEGADPNEIPDEFILKEDMVDSAKTFSVSVILELDSPVSLSEGDTVSQASSGATGTVSFATTNNTFVYLRDTSGVFAASQALNIGATPVDVENIGNDNKAEQLSLYVYDFKNPPTNKSEFDIYFSIGEVDAIERYEVASIEKLTELDTSAHGVLSPIRDGTVYKLNFTTSDSDFNREGLLTDLPSEQIISFRKNQTHIFDDVRRVDELTIRPSTAIIFNENPSYVYRSISFSTTDSIGGVLPNDETLVGFDSTFDFIRLRVDKTKTDLTNIETGTGTMGSTQGDTSIAIALEADLNEIYRLNNNIRTPELNRPLGSNANTYVEAPILTWQGKKHYVFNHRYIDGSGNVVENSNLAEYAVVDIADTGDNISNYGGSGLSSPVNISLNSVILRAGLSAGSTGTVTINISTCRATSHDFLEVGTGGFNTSNYPNVIFGTPRAPQQANEVDERGKGRVFYVSTDQDGVFRVGRFFSVDQGTGTVSFAASIALSDVDGLGFKRGVVVTEFSTDTAMTDNANDSVPTESAVRGYVDRRLGFDVNGFVVPDTLGPAVLSANGEVPLTGNLNAANNTITNLEPPSSDSDAATKGYIDAVVEATDSIQELVDVSASNLESGEPLIGTGFKILLIDANNVVSGPFEIGDIFIASGISNAQGEIVDVYQDTTPKGNVLVIVYNPTLDEVTSGDSLITVIGGASAPIIEGPLTEWANGKWSANSDVEVNVSRQVITDPNTGQITDRITELDLQYKAESIQNADVATDAGILQSKLLLNAASGLSDPTGISQDDLGVAAFDNSIFTSTDGWISIAENGITVDKLAQLQDRTVLGNWRGDSADGNVEAVSFDTVVIEGKGLIHDNFITEVTSVNDPGEALVKTGNETYAVSNISTTGEFNSIVKTDAEGLVQAKKIKIGAPENADTLSLNGTEMIFKTPAGGDIIKASGAGGVAGPIDIDMFGHVNIGEVILGGDPLKTQSSSQGQSNFTGEANLSVDWIYTSFLEAPGETGQGTTGIAIGADTGVTNEGELAIITSDIANNTRRVGFKFNSNGVVPDTDNVYDIGSAGAKYNTIHATLFNGTALEAYYADLAENYVADTDYEPGTVLIFGGDQEVTTTSRMSDHRIAGVVSTNPAYLMNSHQQGDSVVAIALQGRVPCKVIGKVEKGDILVSGAIPGYAIVDNNANAGRIIGKSLQNKNTTEKDIIEIVVGKH